MGSACCGETGTARSPPMSEASYMFGGCPFSKVILCESITAEVPSRKRMFVPPASQDAARVRLPSLEVLLQELFSLHDLNADGVLEEAELVQLNTKVAMLHHGKQADLNAVKAKYRTLFRENLDARGRPVPYDVFRRYLLQVLDAMDPNPIAQEMIMEQFAEEAKAARAVFRAASFASVSDAPFVGHLPMLLGSEDPKSPAGWGRPCSQEGTHSKRPRSFPFRSPSTDSSISDGAMFGVA